MTTQRIPMTREGYEKLKTDLDRMQNFEMIEVTKRIAAARELGDLSENAEYHAAREDQGMLQARIDSLKDKLSRAYFIERTGEEDYDKNKILTDSPLAQGLIGKKVGDVAEIQVPKGTIRFKIMGISFS